MKWSFEEDYVVGKFYLSYVDSWRNHIDELMAELRQYNAGRDKGSARMRVQNFESLHVGKGLANAAKQTKNVYEALVSKGNIPQVSSGVQAYITKNYTPNEVFDHEAFISATSRTTSFVPIEPVGPSFQDLLFKFIDGKKLKDPEVYKRSHIGRDTFSNIRTGKKGVSKRTVKQLCFGLKLSYEDAVMLMASAGFAFSNNDIGDLIVVYFLKNRIYDIYEVDIELHERKQALLFN